MCVLGGVVWLQEQLDVKIVNMFTCPINVEDRTFITVTNVNYL